MTRHQGGYDDQDRESRCSHSQVVANSHFGGRSVRDNRPMDNEIWRWLWTGLAVVLAIGEAFTAGFFLLPFAIGGAVAAILAWLDVSAVWQWIAFFVVSISTLVYLQRFIRRQDLRDTRAIGANRYLGMPAIVLERIDPAAGTGRVRVETEEWRATSGGEVIEPGAPVTIVKVRGTRLVVSERAPRS